MVTETFQEISATVEASECNFTPVMYMFAFGVVVGCGVVVVFVVATNNDNNNKVVSKPFCRYLQVFYRHTCSICPNILTTAYEGSLQSAVKNYSILTLNWRCLYKSRCPRTISHPIHCSNTDVVKCVWKQVYYDNLSLPCMQYVFHTLRLKLGAQLCLYDVESDSISCWILHEANGNRGFGDSDDI